jgi:hypothetical protein
MSLAKKFNIKPTVEDLKEDLKDSLDPVATVDKVEEVTEPQVAEVIEAVVEPETEVADEGDTVDMLEASTPIPAEEIYTVDVTENTPVDEEDLEQVPEFTEEMEYMASEVNKGFEAIEQLNKIANALEAKESKGVSVENYNDFALIALNQVRVKLGMESEENNSTSEKTKYLSTKIIQAIGKIWEKIKEFIRVIFNKININLLNTSKNIKNFIQNSVFDQKEFDVAVVEHYTDKNKVTAKDVYNNIYIQNTEHNSLQISNHLKFLENKFQEILNLHNNGSDQDLSTFKFDFENQIYFNMFDCYSKMKSDVLQINPNDRTAAIKITPDAFLIIDQTGLVKITRDIEIQYKSLQTNKVEKQTYLTPSKNEKQLMENFIKITEWSMSEIKTFAGFNNVLLIRKLEKILNLSTNFDLLYCCKILINEFNQVNKLIFSYYKEIFLGPNYYLKLIEKKQQLNTGGTK